MLRTVAFFSYTRRDDRVAGGLLSAIRGELESRVSTLLGEDVEIFQDTDDIKGGENWRSRLEKAIAEAAYLIPVITPSFFNSGPCRDELERFLGKAEAEGRDGLIVPIHFIECPMIRDEGSAAKDALVKVIEETQWLDFRDHDHKTEIDGDLRRAVIDLAKLLAAKIRDDRLREEREEEQRRLAEEQAKREREQRVAAALAELRAAVARRDEIRRALDAAAVDVRERARAAREIGAGEVALHEVLGVPVPAATGQHVLARSARPYQAAPAPSAFRDGLLKHGGKGPELVVIPPGRFLMGSPEDENGRSADEGPRHEVAIGRPFALGRYPVTFAEYDLFCDVTGHPRPGDAGWGRDRRPVIHVSWDDAAAYLDWLSGQTGVEYRLPSEAEWEYACRAGTATARWWGGEWDPTRANGNRALGRTSEVDEYPPNPWGLHDMIGNVWQMCAEDWTNDYRAGKAQVPPPATRSAHRIRVARGGSWCAHPGELRSAARANVYGAPGVEQLGFRAARTLVGVAPRTVGRLSVAG